MENLQQKDQIRELRNEIDSKDRRIAELERMLQNKTVMHLSLQKL